MGVIGIDYDVHRVTMAVQRYDLWFIKTAETRRGPAILEHLQFMVENWDATHVALEKPFLKRWTDKKTGAQKYAPQAHAQLWRVYGRIEVLCEQVGIIVVPAPPSVWQAAMLTPQHGKLGGSAERKKLSMMVAEELGAECANDHEADAVCMAEWLDKQLRLERAEV